MIRATSPQKGNTQKSDGFEISGKRLDIKNFAQDLQENNYHNAQELQL